MNQKERLKLKEVLRQLEHGPGAGWFEALSGGRNGYDLSIEEREKSLRLWLGSWILPPIADVVQRYGETRGKARR